MGLGSQFVYKCLINQLKGQLQKVCVVASTGIAATLIGGVTAHKRFGLPLDLEHHSVSKISAHSKEADFLRSCSLIIWDEATASHKYALDIVDSLLKDCMKNDLPFGGKTVVLGGDFRQCLPIVTKGTNAQQVSACIKMGKQWHLFVGNIFSFTENMRSNDPLFANWLLAVGNGLVPNPVELDPLKMHVVSKPIQLVTATFGTVINSQNIRTLLKNIIVSPTNVNVQLLNAQVLALVEGPNCMRYSIDTVDIHVDGSTKVPIEFTQKLTPPGMPPHILNIKVNGIYMLLRNMNVEQGLCNGSRFLVKDINKHSLVCELIRDDPGQPAFIFILPRIVCTPPAKYSFQFKRRQFPIRPAFCMTINKCQGGTFWKVGIDVSTPVFSHGQLYVALSRVANFTMIIIFTTNGVFFTQNVVFRAVFDRGYLDAQVRIQAPRPNLPGRIATDEDVIIMPSQDNPIVPEQTDASDNLLDGGASHFLIDQENNDPAAMQEDAPLPMPEPGFSWDDLIEQDFEEWPHHVESADVCVGIDLLSYQGQEDIEDDDRLLLDD